MIWLLAAGTIVLPLVPGGWMCLAGSTEFGTLAFGGGLYVSLHALLIWLEIAEAGP